MKYSRTFHSQQWGLHLKDVTFVGSNPYTKVQRKSLVYTHPLSNSVMENTPCRFLLDYGYSSPSQNRGGLFNGTRHACFLCSCFVFALLYLVLSAVWAYWCALGFKEMPPLLWWPCHSKGFIIAAKNFSEVLLQVSAGHHLFFIVICAMA